MQTWGFSISCSFWYVLILFSFTRTLVEILCYFVEWDEISLGRIYILQGLTQWTNFNLILDCFELLFVVRLNVGINYPNNQNKNNNLSMLGILTKPLTFCQKIKVCDAKGIKDMTFHLLTLINNKKRIIWIFVTSY